MCVCVCACVLLRAKLSYAAEASKKEELVVLLLNKRTVRFEFFHNSQGVLGRLAITCKALFIRT